MSEAKAENIKVVVRCRPLSKGEQEKGYFSIVKVLPSAGQVQLYRNQEDNNPKTFQFNSAYPPDITQQFIYDDCARPIVDAVLEGFNGTIFAYGQTGTGKTYTMEGDISSEEDKGITLHAFDHIFAYISSVKDREFLVRASYLQIYMENVFDLLGDPSKKLHVRNIDNDVAVVGLSTHIVKSPQEIMDVLVAGRKNRVVAATSMNSGSSRSHSVFSIIIEQHSEDRGTRMGKLHLVDLAGSERLSKTEASGLTAKQGAKINQSLLELGNVISALVTNKTHISYRNSKLTQILQDSLGGNSKTCMCATIGPSSYSYEETNSTLLYATRARDIKNIPKINEDPKDALIGQLRDKIAELKRQLAEQEANGGIPVPDNSEMKAIEAAHKKKMEELMAKKNITEEERRKMKDDLEGEYEKQKQIKEQNEALKQKLKQMEQSVLIGGENLVTKAKQQEEEIRRQKSEERKQIEIQRQLEEKRKEREDKLLLVEKKYSSMKDELTEKQETIKKLEPLIKTLEQNIDDIQAQFESEKEEQSKHIKKMQKEIALLRVIAESFIPPDQLDQILSKFTYDSAEQKVTIPYQELAGRRMVQEKEEELEENTNIFIQGVDGPLDFLSTHVDITMPSKEEVMQAKQKRQLNVQHALAGLGMVGSLFSKKKTNPN